MLRKRSGGEQMRTATDLDCVFKPRSVAVVGASNSVLKWGYIILANIIAGGYDGRLYPVNPKGGSIQGLKAYPDVMDVPDEIDLAIVITPARTTPAVLKRLIQKGVKAAVVVPGGFSEEGAAGAALEEEIAKIARDGELRLVGPNTMGVFGGGRHLTALMPPVAPDPGVISFVSQSGNLGTQLLGMAQSLETGISKFVSSGNEGVLFTEDYIEYFGNDPETKVILAYIEGLDHGRKFLEVAKRVTRKKPLIVFKGGRTRAGSRAASSHTGALAGSSAVYDAAFRQAGAIIASAPDEMFRLARAFASLPLPKGNRVGIITWGGGWGVVTADCCERAGLDVVDLPEDALREIDAIMPPYWSRGNPIDLVAELNREVHRKCFDILAACDNVDAVIVLGIVSTSTIFNLNRRMDAKTREQIELFKGEAEKMDIQFEKHINATAAKYGKPILGATMQRGRQSENLAERSVIYTSPHRAVNVLAGMCEYRRYLDSLEEE